MAYTPPTKLATAEHDAADSLGANYRVYCPCVENAGGPRDIVGNMMPSPSAGLYMRATGAPPTWFSGLNGPALRGAPHCGSLVYRGRGLTTGTTRTFFAVIRPRFSASPFPLDFIPFLSNHTDFGSTGGGIIIDNASGAYRLRLNSAGSSVGPTTPVAIPQNVWQAIAVTIDDTPASGSRVRNFYQFNYADETSQTQSITNATTAISPTTSAHFALFPDVQMGAAPIWGNYYMDVSVFGLDSVAWNQAAFDAFRANPEKGSLGTYTPAGGLTASVFHRHSKTTTTVIFHGARPTGGQAPYSAQLHRSTTPNFTPTDGGGTMVASGTITGGSIVLTDPSPTAHDAAPSFYRILWKDSAGTPATVVGPQTHPASKARRAELVLGWIGDSISIIGLSTGPIGNPPQACARFLAGHGYYVRLVNRAVGGTSAFNATTTSSWQPSALQPGTTLFDSALATFQAEGVTHCGIQLGTNDARLSTTSPANLKTYLGNVTAALVAAGITPIVFGPPMPVQNLSALSSAADDTVASAAKVEVLKDYWTALNAEPSLFADGTVKRGCDLMGPSIDALDSFNDGVHPQAALIEYLGALQAEAIQSVLYPTQGTTVRARPFRPSRSR